MKKASLYAKIRNKAVVVSTISALCTLAPQGKGTCDRQASRRIPSCPSYLRKSACEGTPT